MIEIDHDLDLQLTNELIVDTAAEIYDDLLDFVQQAAVKQALHRSKLVLSLVGESTLYPEEVLTTLYGLTYGGDRHSVVTLEPKVASPDGSVYWAGCIGGSTFYVKEDYEFGLDDVSRLSRAYAFAKKPSSGIDIKPNFETLDTPVTSDSVLSCLAKWLMGRSTSI